MAEGKYLRNNGNCCRGAKIVNKNLTKASLPALTHWVLAGIENDFTFACPLQQKKGQNDKSAQHKEGFISYGYNGSWLPTQYNFEYRKLEVKQLRRFKMAYLFWQYNTLHLSTFYWIQWWTVVTMEQKFCENEYQHTAFY